MEAGRLPLPIDAIKPLWVRVRVRVRVRRPQRAPRRGKALGRPPGRQAARRQCAGGGDSELPPDSVKTPFKERPSQRQAAAAGPLRAGVDRRPAPKARIF